MWVQDPDDPSRWRRWDGKRLISPEPHSFKHWAVAAQLLGVVTSAIGPLLIKYTVGRRSRFVNHHATESANFQITLIVLQLAVSFIGGAVALAIVGIIGIDSALAAVNTFSAFSWLGIVALNGFALYAAAQANRGRWYRYPFSLRMFNGGERAQPSEPVAGVSEWVS